MDFEKILDLILKELSTFQVNGKFIFDAENINNIDQVDALIQKVLKDNGYFDLIADYQKDFQTALSESIKDYAKFGAKKTELLTNFNNIVFKNFENDLKFGFTQTNIAQPIKTALIQYLGSEGNFKDFRTAVLDLVKTNKLEVNVDNVAREMVFSYKRAQSAQLADKFNVQYFRYVNPPIDTTRDFCKKRHGNYYDKKTIQSWASLTWDGKRDGTNASNIFIYGGGYNCRCSIIGVSEKQAKDSGKLNKYN
jgi:hypothetical protein